MKDQSFEDVLTLRKVGVVIAALIVVAAGLIVAVTIISQAYGLPSEEFECKNYSDQLVIDPQPLPVEQAK